MKFLLSILHSKTMTILLCLILGLIVGASSIYSLQQNAQAALQARVLYLVPGDPNRIEKNLTEKALFETSDLQVGTTSDWNIVEDLASKGQLDALVIHHAALESVHQEQLQKWYRNGVVVAGIGIPAKAMAALLAMPALNIWDDQETYKTSSYFYMFSLKVKASDQDKQKIVSSLEQNGVDVPPGGIQGPTSTMGGASTDSLVTEEGKKRFPSALEQHIADQP